MSLSEVADLLSCPRCREPLRLEGRTLSCPARHAYDLAKQGYVNLLGGPQPKNADTADMLAARTRFLGAGHYAPVADAVREAVGDARTIADAGAGNGYYLARALPDGGRGVALDVSVAAARAAARCSDAVGSVVADTWATLPLLDHSCDAVLAIFAPKNFAEFARALRPGGVVATVTPTAEHLAEVRGTLGLLGIESEKASKLRDAAASYLEFDGTRRLDASLQLSAEAVADLVAMGPNAFHQRDVAPDATSVTLSVDITRFRAA